MTRTFAHEFEPSHLNRIGSQVELTSAEIEQAGLLEVLQTPGALLMSGALLESLLSPTSSQFLFAQHLGQAREVKVALSGLLGRFVARAYLTRHHGYTFYAHLSSAEVTLDGVRRVRVAKNSRGDLPDWVVWQPAGDGLAIAEAKGSHDRLGPQSARDRAWAQAQRVDLLAGGRKLPLKRFAIATRWGVANSTLSQPIIAVLDPEEPGDATPEEIAAAAMGIARRHIANLLRPLGHSALADCIDKLCRDSYAPGPDGIRSALAAVDNSPARRLQRDGADVISADRLIGGIVTRAGVLGDGAGLPVEDQEVLGRLDLGATFVGVGADLVRASIKGDLDELKLELVKSRLSESEAIRTDRAGTWVQRLGDGYLAV